MLKPSDTWKWYFEDESSSLMLDLGQNMLFQTNLVRKLLVDCAIGNNEFTVDDASAFQTYKEQIQYLGLSEPRQAELTLYCVAAKRFHKPVQPKSWFFDYQGEGYQPCEGDIISLANENGQGHFIVLEVGDNASLCISVERDSFMLTSSKMLNFGDSIKVMHDRMACANHILASNHIALVG
ncbi:cell division protein ZapC [Vibrionales bacterium C3R12]|nr:cell division protein ZapC [Vibrionales bacterium C3R12]